MAQTRIVDTADWPSHPARNGGRMSEQAMAVYVILTTSAAAYMLVQLASVCIKLRRLRKGRDPDNRPYKAPPETEEGKCKHEGRKVPGITHWQCDKCGVWISSNLPRSKPDAPPETEKG